MLENSKVSYNIYVLEIIFPPSTSQFIYYIVHIDLLQEGFSTMEYKTNVMRLLDKKKVNYKHYSYADTDAISGIDVALVLGQSPNQVFKTLVTIGKSGKHYVFVVPVSEELDLKKAAASIREKSISMLKSKDLLSLTGYIHGGCSPIGMKKYFPTVIDHSAMELDTIIFSAGKIGYQVEIELDELKKMIRFELHDIVIK